MEAASGALQPRQPSVQPPTQGISPLQQPNDVLPPKRQAVVDRLRRRIESYRRRQNDCMPRFDQSFNGICEQNLADTLALKQRFLDAKAAKGGGGGAGRGGGGGGGAQSGGQSGGQGAGSGSAAAKNKEKKLQQQQAAAAAAAAQQAAQQAAAAQAQQQQQANVEQQGATQPGQQPQQGQAAANQAASTALQSSIHVQQKFLKRTSEDLDSSGQNSENFEPPVKLQCTTQQHQSEVHKFSVEIVQQLEFTTSAANSQPQQISTNVTVKALTNTSVKSDVASPKSNPSTPSNINRNSGIGCVDIGTLVECKQEPDNDFADLDQCAAALEKDAAANGTSFAGISDLIGDDTNDEIITPDDFKSLISEISDYPEFMKDFDLKDFEDKVVNDNLINTNGLKTEEKDVCQQLLSDVKNTQSPLLQNAQYSPPVFDNQINKARMPYSGMDFNKSELSPAAQTLKQMAEQHQVKNQLGLAFNPNPNRTPNARSPYTDFNFQNDYVGSPNSTQNQNFHNKNFQPDMIKQEMIFQNEFDMKRKGAGIYKQQYSPYGSPSASGHGSPGYLPRGQNTNGPQAGQQQGAFSGGTPPRPSSGPGNQTSANLQINQAQQLHINQQGHGHSIQVSAGQHLHLSGDIKGNVSVAQQQGLYFNQAQQLNQQQNASQQGQNPGSNIGSQQSQGQQGPLQSGPHMGNPNQQSHDSYSVSQSQTINFTQQTLRQRAVVPNQGMPPNQMAPSGMPGARTMTPQTLEQQKLMQQQQLLRAQQQMQQQHMMGMGRPPPPDYKTSAGMMHGMQPRYPQAPQGVRTRMGMGNQPMPPSGPMMRPHNMYMMSQQHMARGMYPRQQTALSGGVGDTMPQQSAEWRHLVMNQQQTTNFNPQMRPNFQQGYSVGNAGGGMPMSVLPQQQMRNQNMGMGMGGMGQNPMGQSQGNLVQGNQMGGPNQMNMQLNQQMMSVQQQNMLQQNSNQMGMGGIHMSQSQSLTISNQTLQQNQLNSQLVNQQTSQTTTISNFSQQSPDFNLDNLLNSDTSNFTDQELLNSFDSDAGFNLQDIL